MIESETSLPINENSGLNANGSYAFPLIPGSGLRNRLWQQILSIAEEGLFFNQLNERMELSNNKLAVLK